ncbi:TPA: TRAP transporter small permease [Pasteurella multocida]|uniref:TRAP transporter small permease protein n=2 Tax=Pasteurella multocida TaxID=747 RepID=A0A1E3XKK2_PASMD|nr:MULTISPECIES: TRAP transporter small permease [Pasteurella]AWW59724.1 TRAP transporter small permease [Pasteurellaceae bacterium 12591]AIN48086.1 tripartite ATP-independent periplasmic transporter, DctQ component family protein [Pasteurella multocida]AMM81693.1 TRAP dicarboxylate transporter subunit DctQ [Pasteurella multocida subsp. multocida PMTB2.1]AON57645.1 TRAP dicarboxylate transporter subunit DctQ [Pasteurella multocida]APW58284.1 TRAP dicarboxylate transporter subunit DctQ [Pasteur
MLISKYLLWLCNKLDQIFIKVGYYVSYIFLLVVIIGFYEVVARYLFSSPTLWVHEVTTFLISLSLLYGGVACYASNKHIAMTFIRQKLPNKIKWLLELLVEILIFIFFILLSYGAYLSAREALFTPSGKFKMQTSGSVLDMPFPAIEKSFFFISCLIIVVLSVLHIFRHIYTKYQEELS